MKAQIEKWLSNCLTELRISEVMSTIGSTSNVAKAVKQYNLENYFNDIACRLNNYKRSNGYAYYNRNINAYREGEIRTQMKTLLDDMRYITVAFFFLLTLCDTVNRFAQIDIAAW